MKMKNLLLILFTFSSMVVFSQDTCPPDLIIDYTDDDRLDLVDVSDLDCDDLGTTLTVLIDGETFQYTLDECSGMVAIYDLDAGDVLGFDDADEIVVTFGDGSVGTYIVDGRKTATLETCEAPSPIPTLSQWGLILLFLLASIFGILGLHKRGKEVFVVN
jgi:hypothetical protein